MGLTIEKSFQYFLDNNFDNYKEGEWIAIYEKNVIAHGLTLKKVLEKVKNEGKPLSKVLISKVKKTASYL
ncbi:MAG: hypothetical protein QT03_C0001G1267 [archaeon GW2011_AR10]|uniref:DUF5678 domain-containing protein n=2 Tax=Candidatus Iainarchaeum sp. TaxID=3101447 RepID=A0A7J4IYS2_9ARCH|nr:MAG: hypothetical protein QT03_C0001G1267 [archaeon GW2011_AR10]HIH08116.1 hypothetical protein [Candidatus Diapherotrites archaeon]